MFSVIKLIFNYFILEGAEKKSESTHSVDESKPKFSEKGTNVFQEIYKCLTSLILTILLRILCSILYIFPLVYVAS